MGFSRPGTKDGLGTFRTPFSAHRYKDIQKELSHVTLAQRGRALGKTLALRATQGDAVLLHHRSEDLTTRADEERKEVALGRVQGLEQG